MANAIANMSVEQQQKLLAEMLEKKQRDDARRKEYYERTREQRDAYAAKRRVYTKLMLEKAKAAGLTVSDEEVEAELKKEQRAAK